MRTQNLIQSYINSHPASKKYNSDKAAKDFDVQKELSNRTFIKPLPGNGRLLKTGLFDTPSEMARGFKYNLKALKHAIKGEANDHELGRLNDVGMKLGGLAIASYLCTRKQTPHAKLFEFIGLTSFFAAMDIWPKLFLQLPARLIHGIDIRQEYEDSFGRKKMFYQDHQFIPWDLYSDKDIHKIGDRWGIPKDIPNRREFIQEKMRKIALQNNTMWMLTAGFATPIMSALICNALEKPVENFQNRRLEAKANSLMENFNLEAAKYPETENTKALNSLLDKHKTQTLTTDIVSDIEKLLTKGLDPMTASAVKQDLAEDLAVGKTFKISKETLTALQESIKKEFAFIKLSDEDMAKIMPDENTLLEAFQRENLLDNETSDFSAHTKAFYNTLEEKIGKFVEQNPDSKIAKQLNFALGKMVHATNESGESPVQKLFKENPAQTLTENIISKIQKVNDVLVKFKANTKVLRQHAQIQVGQAEHTLLADIWNNSADNIMKALQFTPEEISKGKLDREIAGEILRNKMEHITSNKETFDAYLTQMKDVLQKMYSKTSAMSIESENSSYKAAVNNTFNNATNDLNGLGMEKTIQTLIGLDNSQRASLKHDYLSFVADRITGVKSSFYRFLEMSHLYYKVSQMENIGHILSGDMLREVKEELVELAKSTLLEAHTSDFAVKFAQRRNITPQQQDYSQIEVKDGKVINKYYDQIPNGEKVELPHDKNYFNKAMKLIFGDDVHKDIYEKFKDEVFFEDYKAFRRSAYEKLGGEKNFAYPHVLLEGRIFEGTSGERFNKLGCAPDQFMLKLFNNKFNSKTWFTTFGKLGAAVAGVTLLSQFFFGHMKKPTSEKEAK